MSVRYLLFLLIFNVHARSVSVALTLHHGAETIENNSSWFEIKLLEYPALRFHVDISVMFPREMCCPVIRLLANSQNRSYDIQVKHYGTKNCIPSTVLPVFSSFSVSTFFVLSNNANSRDCHWNGQYYICNITTTILHYEPKSFWLIIHYECGEEKNLFGLQFEYTIKMKNTTICESIQQTKANDASFLCGQFYNYTSFPNPFGRTSLADASQFLFALRATLFQNNELCHKHLDYILCQIIFPRCPNGTTENNNIASNLTVVCEEMCEEVLHACSDAIGSISQFVDCSYFRRANENDTDCTHLPVTCDPPPLLENGKVTNFGNENYNVKSTVHFSCDNGYKLEGNNTSKCQFSGTWTPPPVCKSLLYIHLTIAGVSFVVILMLAIVIVFYFWKHKARRRTENYFESQPLQKRNSEFDAFVSYTYQASIDFVKNFVHPKLELEPKPPLKLLFHTRDFHGATLIYQNILDGVRKSNCAIVLMSQEYIDAPWCKEEFQVSEDMHVKSIYAKIR